MTGYRVWDVLDMCKVFPLCASCFQSAHAHNANASFPCHSVSLVQTVTLDGQECFHGISGMQASDTRRVYTSNNARRRCHAARRAAHS